MKSSIKSYILEYCTHITDYLKGHSYNSMSYKDVYRYMNNSNLQHPFEDFFGTLEVLYINININKLISKWHSPSKS